MPAGRILSTIDLPHRAAWAARVDAVRREDVSRPALVRRIVSEAPGYDAVVLDASVGPSERYSDVLAAVALARRKAAPPVVLAECTWKLGSSVADRLACRAGARLLDTERSAYCVLSSAERDLFARTWGVDRERVFVTHYCITAPDEDLVPAEGLGHGVFSGGDAVRDYSTLLEVARGLDAPVTIASSRLDGADDLPPNVRAGRIPFEEFQRGTREARVIVLALEARDDRSAGQQTYLNAMALGKLVVVPDLIGVRDYIDDGETGLIVPPGDAAALRRALDWALDDANAERIREIGRAARAAALGRFGAERYVDAMLGVADAMIARRTAA